MDAEDLAASRPMTPQEKLTRALKLIERIRQFKIESVRVHHPGWSEEKVMDEVRGWVRNGMNPAELYDWWATRSEEQYHPIQAGVETAIGSFGTLVSI